MLRRALLVSAAVAAVFAACGDDDGTTGGPDGADASAGDSSSDGSNDASSGADGSDATLPDGGAPLFAFVGSGDGKIRVYAVDEGTGAWTFRNESSAGTSPSFLAFDPSRRRVVAVDEIGVGVVRSFSFDPVTGALGEINAQPVGGAGPTHLSLDPSGRWVLVASYNEGNAAVFPIDTAGTLGDASATVASGPQSHWAGTSPSGDHAYVVSLGSDAVVGYALDRDAGTLTDAGVTSVAAGAGPRHLAFHPSAKWAYVIDELAVDVTVFDFTSATGALAPKQAVSALPVGQPSAGVTGAEIAVHPSGKVVYASTRGFNAIARFSVSASDGTLTFVDSTTTGAPQPRSFGMSPEGTLLFAGNQASAEVVGFSIDASGALTPLGKVADVPSPTFVGLARMR